METSATAQLQPSCTRITGGMLRVTCYVLRVTSYVLRVTCYVLRVTCYVLRVTCRGDLLLIATLQCARLYDSERGDGESLVL